MAQARRCRAGVNGLFSRKDKGIEKLKDLMIYNDRLVKEAELTPAEANKLSVKREWTYLIRRIG